MADKKILTTGIILKYGYAGNDKMGWNSTIEFSDMAHCNTKSCSGEIHTKYFCPSIDEAIDTILEDMKFMNIQFIDEVNSSLKRTIYYFQDGESPEFPPPKNWKQLIKEQCEKRNFEFIY